MVGAAALVGVAQGRYSLRAVRFIAVLAPAGQAGKYFGLFAYLARPLALLRLSVLASCWASLGIDGRGIIVVFLLAGLALLNRRARTKETA